MIKESLFAAEEREAKLDMLGDVLQILNQHVDFATLALAIDTAAPRPNRERGGRQPFPTELMVKTLLLQQLYNLSDEQLEFQLLDRLSFQRFVGLRYSSQIPDRTTFWTFRERLIAAGASETIFAAVNRELEKRGYLARGGQIVDASIITAPRQHVSSEEKKMLKDKAMPIDWSKHKRRQKDSDANWTKKHGKVYFGYKISINVDKQYKCIRELHVSKASEHDTLHLEAVLDHGNTCQELYADKGYADQKREVALKKEGIRVNIQRKAAKNKPLSDCQKGRNQRIAKKRARVEHVFASLTQMGGKGLRSIGLARAKMQLHAKAVAPVMLLDNRWREASICLLNRLGAPDNRQKAEKRQKIEQNWL